MVDRAKKSWRYHYRVRSSPTAGKKSMMGPSYVPIVNKSGKSSIDNIKKIQRKKNWIEL